jgi:hypothetical protein
MSTFLRMTSVAATAATLALTAAPAIAASSTSVTANPQAQAHARILRPLTLISKQDLDLGTIALGQGAFSTTVGIAKDGTWTCDTTKVTCSAPHQVARYNVAGTNNRTVTVAVSNVTMTSGANTLLLIVDAPATVDLGASGTAGVDFDIGGSVSLADTTPDGVYTGTFDVTADYQ